MITSSFERSQHPINVIKFSTSKSKYLHKMVRFQGHQRKRGRRQDDEVTEAGPGDSRGRRQ